MRHPDFECFWKQERSDCIVTKCSEGSEIYQQLGETYTGDCYFFSCVAVYVRKGCDEADGNWENEFFSSMGGKSHVKCQCRNYPLLVTNKSAKKRRKCNWKGCLDVNGEYTDHNGCNRKEAFICSNPYCSVRLCRKCYATFSTESSTTVVPCENDHADDANGSVQSSQDELNETSDTDEDVSTTTLNQEGMETVMENFVVSTLQDLTLDLTEDNQESNVGIPCTDAGDIAMNVGERSHTRVSGHVIFNQVGSCLSRKTKQINGNNPQKFWVQSLCSTSAGESSPLLQPEASLFPRHFYASAERDPKSILGSRPLPLLSSKKHSYGFESTLQHARIRMTDPSSSTSTDPKLMCCYYDELGNVTAGASHSRDIFERGFVVDSSSSSGMAVREKGYTDLSASVDSQKMVRNLARSQKYIKWDWFLTFTLNQQLHPGLAHLSDWKDSKEWTKYIPGYNNMSAAEHAEIQRAMEEASGPHIYSNWHAVMFLLLRHIKDHLSAIGTNMAIFGRGEYQESAANVCHWHIITAVDRSTMNEESERYIQDLIRTSVFEVVRTNDDIERFLANGLLKSIDEIPELQELANTILRHECDDRCVKRVGDDDGPESFRCRKKHSVKDNPDPASHCYIPFKVKYEQSTLDVLEEIGIYSPLQDPNDPNDHGTFSHGYFTPSSHIAPCNFNADCNMSPVIPDFFVTTKSMQNAQALENTNGLAKYVCKYVAKFDDGNYILLKQDVHTGQWILHKVKLHNTKISGSKLNEDKAFEKSRDKGHPRGREVTYFEIRQIMMGDPEVFTDLSFIPISTLPFELRPTNIVELDDNGDVIHPDEDEVNGDGHNNPDSFTEGIPMQRARMQIDLSEWHRMTESQMLTHRNHNGKSSKYDQISIFSLRPPELLGVFRNPIDYFRHCYIDEDDCFDEDGAEEALCEDVRHCPWIDCLGRKIKMYALALNDVFDLIEANLEEYESIDQLDEANEFRIWMNLAIKDMILAYQASESGDQLNNGDLHWVEDTIRPNFIHFDESMKNLPIPVASDVRPDNAHQFLTHIILSMGKYDTEIDALSHPSTRECLKAVGLIGNASDVDHLKHYANDLTRTYIYEQLVYYAISLTVAETFIVTSKNVMDDAIINNSLSMNELPPFTMATLRMSTNAQNEQWWTNMKESQLDSIYSTLRHTAGIPTREDLNNVTRNSPLMWNPTDAMTRYERQSNESFVEQKYAIGLEIDQINRYRNANQEGDFTYLKNTVIYGAPGTGKSFVSQYLVLYAISQGLNVISTALMGVRANALGGGGMHLHQLFKLPTEENGTLTPFKAAQAAIEKIYRQVDLLHALLTVDVIFIDECSQVSSETLVKIDMILRKLRGNSQTPFGGVHIIGTMDNSQLQPIAELPFLASSFMLTCFVMVKLEHSVRAYGDVEFQRLQQISRMDPYELRASHELKTEFFELAGRILNFVPDWDSDLIGPNMMRAFSRKNPAKRTLDGFREKIKSQLVSEGVPFHVVPARDTQKRKGTNGDYVPASDQCIKQLDREMKEPRELVFFPGGVYECTINDRHKGFSQSQLALLIDLPSEEDIISKHEIKMWIAPPATGQISFDRRQLPSRVELESLGWREVFIGCTPERDVNVRGGLVGRRFQYSLKHIGATTINKSQGATLPYGIAVEISEQYSPWESGQIVVVISRTESSAYTIIVGEKNFAIRKMWELITTGNQWSRYTKHILENITANPNAARTMHRNVIYHDDTYPFRRIDATIPLDSTGFVYCLTSTRRPHKIYIGQTKNLSQRLDKHNRGEGAEETRDPRDRPWAIGSYICGLMHMNKVDRETLERNWKDLVHDMKQQGLDSSYSWIMAGRRLIQRYNEGCVDDAQHIRFVAHVKTEV